MYFALPAWDHFIVVGPRICWREFHWEVYAYPVSRISNTPCKWVFVFFNISQSVVTLDGDKLVHVQKWDGKETNFVREIKDGRMVMVSTKVTEHSCTPLTLLLHICLKLVNFTGICNTEPKPRVKLVDTSQIITFCLASRWKIADGSVAPGRPVCGFSKCILSRVHGNAQMNTFCKSQF